MENDILNYDGIKNKLNTEYIGRNLNYHDSINSTNLRAKAIALDEPEGTVIISDEQTQGIGRLGRNWTSPKGKGLYMSIILKPEVEAENVSKITLIGAAAVTKALEDMEINSGIKWPNDIVINGKKVSGVLTEMSCESYRVNYVVMGIGVNVNLDREDIPHDLRDKATSLKIVTDKEINRQLLLANILNRFEELYNEFKSGHISTTIEICRKKSVLLGEEVRIIKDKETKIGKAIEINSKGQLVVQFQNGVVENIISGEVSIRGMDGYI